MIRDRGMLKYEAFIMPEQKSMLREFFREYYSVEKPILDEQKLEEIEFTVVEAMENNSLLNIVYYNNGKYELIVGSVEKVNGRELLISDTHNDKFRINVSNLIDVQLN